MRPCSIHMGGPVYLLGNRALAGCGKDVLRFFSRVAPDQREILARFLLDMCGVLSCQRTTQCASVADIEFTKKAILARDGATVPVREDTGGIKGANTWHEQGIAQ